MDKEDIISQGGTWGLVFGRFFDLVDCDKQVDEVLYSSLRGIVIPRASGIDSAKRPVIPLFEEERLLPGATVRAVSLAATARFGLSKEKCVFSGRVAVI